MSLFSLSVKQVRRQLSESDDPLAELQKMQIPPVVLKEVFAETKNHRSIHFYSANGFQFHIVQKNDGDVMIRLPNTNWINAFNNHKNDWMDGRLTYYQETSGDEKTLLKARFADNCSIANNLMDWEANLLSEICLHLVIIMPRKFSTGFSLHLVSHPFQRMISTRDNKDKTFSIPSSTNSFYPVDIETLLNFFFK